MANNDMINLNKIRQLITKPALYEQLAEECAELSQASLKMARILRNENTTPITINEAGANILEEFSDIMLCTKVLGLTYSGDIMSYKLNRWVERNSD